VSILIDDLVRVYSSTASPVYRRVGNVYKIAKDCDYYGLCGFIQRIKDAYRVLIGKSRAYHYYEDEYTVD
jgi:hypothetical protein